jgi:Methyltransferase domain
MSEAAVDAAIAALPLPSEPLVLDTGCGSSEMLLRVLRTHVGARGLGVDLDADAITEAHQRAATLPARFEVRDAATLEGPFDAPKPSSGTSPAETEKRSSGVVRGPWGRAREIDRAHLRGLHGPSLWAILAGPSPHDCEPSWRLEFVDGLRECDHGSLVPSKRSCWTPIAGQMKSKLWSFESRIFPVSHSMAMEMSPPIPLFP